jgi:hypothetical protein
MKKCEHGDLRACAFVLPHMPNSQLLTLGWRFCDGEMGKAVNGTDALEIATFCLQVVDAYGKSKPTTPEDFAHAAASFDELCSTGTQGWCEATMALEQHTNAAKRCQNLCVEAVETAAGVPALVARPAFSDTVHRLWGACMQKQQLVGSCAGLAVALGRRAPGTLTPEMRRWAGSGLKAGCDAGTADDCFGRALSGLGESGPLNALQRADAASRACETAKNIGYVCLQVGTCFEKGNCGFAADMSRARRAYAHGCGVKNGIFPKNPGPSLDQGCCARFMKLQQSQ